MEIEDKGEGTKARLVGRRLIGGPESWDPNTQEAVRAMAAAAKTLAAIPVEVSVEEREELLKPRSELNDYVRQMTDLSAYRWDSDPVFHAKVLTVVGIAEERRAYEGYPFDDYDRAHAKAMVALALVMHDQLEAAHAKINDKLAEDG